MKQIINVREANQHLSRYIAAAQNGEEIIITYRNKPVVKMTAYSTDIDESDKFKLSRKRSLERMKKGYSLGGSIPSRESIHER
jgi:prevent-host-death family protein